MRCAMPASPRTTRVRTRFGSRLSPTVKAPALAALAPEEPASRSAGKLGASGQQLPATGSRWAGQKPPDPNAPDQRPSTSQQEGNCRCCGPASDAEDGTGQLRQLRNLVWGRPEQALQGGLAHLQPLGR